MSIMKISLTSAADHNNITGLSRRKYGDRILIINASAQTAIVTSILYILHLNTAIMSSLLPFCYYTKSGKHINGAFWIVTVEFTIDFVNDETSGNIFYRFFPEYF